MAAQHPQSQGIPKRSKEAKSSESSVLHGFEVGPTLFEHHDETDYPSQDDLAVHKLAMSCPTDNQREHPPTGHPGLDNLSSCVLG